MWYYPCNGAKCDSILVTVTYCGLGSMITTCIPRSLLIDSVIPMLCLKDPQMGNDTIHPEFLLTLFPNPSARVGYDTRSIFKQSLTGLNSELSFSLTSCLTKVEEPSLSFYLPIAGGRIIGFIPFPRVLVLCEMQSALFRIWTRVAMSISYDDNHYTTATSISSDGWSGSLEQVAWVLAIQRQKKSPLTITNYLLKSLA